MPTRFGLAGPPARPCEEILTLSLVARVSKAGVAKLIDFGTAARLPEEAGYRNSAVGTPWYCAPEVIMSEDYSQPADVWSLGCSLIELATGARRFPASIDSLSRC